MNKIKVFIIILMTELTIILVLLTAIYFVIGYYFYNIALSPNTSKAFILGQDADEVQEQEAIEQVKKSKTPTLFIHGEKYRFVPFEMLDKLYEAATCKKEKLVIKGDAHAESCWVNPDLYWKTTNRFIEENL